MSNPSDVTRLREIKRLLDRIQQLPHIAGSAGNGVQNGLHAVAFQAPEEVATEAVLSPPPADAMSYHPHADPAPYWLPADPTPYRPLAGAVPYRLPADPMPYRFPADAVPYQEPMRREESRALVPVQPASAVSISPWLFVTATAVNTMIAAVLAVVITLGVARRETATNDAEKAAATSKTGGGVQAPAQSKDHVAPALSRPIELLPIGSPGEPLRLEALKPSRLPLQVRPEEALQESYILVLSGLPANATLSGATRMGSDSWLLLPGALKQLEIIVPEWSASLIEVKVELRRTNGAMAAQTKAWLAVPPPPIPQDGKLNQTAINELLQAGDRLLARGDVAAARALYERAAAMGSAQAALALGSTYDPGRLWSLGVFGMVGNKERARHWYQRADQLGHPDAKDRVRTLKD